MPEEIWNLDDPEEQKPPANRGLRGIFFVGLILLAILGLLFFAARWYGIESSIFDVLRL